MSVVGRWRIVDMELWDQDAVDLVAPGFIEFRPDSTGSFGFIAVQGALDWRQLLAKGARTSSSPGKASTRVILRAVAAGRRWNPTAVCVVTSTSTWATTPASTRHGSRAGCTRRYGRELLDAGRT
jgi:hypothetical protein